MKVHLTGSSRSLDEDFIYMQAIVEAVHKSASTIVLNWIESANYKTQQNNPAAKWDWADIVSNNLDAISRANVVIIEGTNHGFFQGFQAAIALERRRPVLFLARDDVSNRPIAGIHSKLLTAKQYKTQSELTKIVRTFLEKHASLNVQIVMSDKTLQFLKGEALVQGKSEAEIIDSLVSEKSR